MKESIKEILVISIATLMMFLLTLLVFNLGSDKPVTEHNKYDNYSLQAMAWRDGRTTIDKYYNYLELAILNDEYFSEHSKDDYDAYADYFIDSEGKIIDHEENEYYVSFPPFPTIPMYLLSFIYGGDTPNNLLSIIYCAAAFLFAILTMRRMGFSRLMAISLAALMSIASSAFALGANKLAGSVWYQAQNLSLLLTMASFFCITGNKKSEHYIACILLAFAVGCRPFQIIYFMMLGSKAPL